VDWLHLAQDRDQLQFLVNDNEPLGYIKGRKFDYVSNYLLSKKDSAPWSQSVSESE